MSPEIEQRILQYALDWPTHGQQRVANELRRQDIQVSPAGVRGVWMRHNLETRRKRLLALEKHAQQESFVLTERQIALLEKHSSDFRRRHVEAARPGELLNQDTFYRGTLKASARSTCRSSSTFLLIWPSQRFTP